MRVGLRTSVSASSSSAMSSSTASSGVPGIDYLSGKAAKWLGLQILSGFATVQIYRRQWVIHRLAKQMKNMPCERRTEWIVNLERDINRKIDDLLELSSYVDRFATLSLS